MGTIEAYGTNIINSKGEGYTQITWDEWNALTPAEQAAIPKAVITNVPGVNGKVSTEFLKTLWVNPSPNSAFAAQNITLASDDYDYLLVSSKCHFGASIIVSFIAPKGHDILTYYVSTSSGTALNDFERLLTHTSDTNFSVAECAYQPSGSARSTNNDYMIPLAIYGFKKNIEFDLTAVVASVSTDASKCMLSDGTSIEDAITYSTTEHVVGSWIDGSPLYEKTIDFGTLPNNSTKEVAHNITNLNHVLDVKGMCWSSNGIHVPLPFSYPTTENCIGVYTTATAVAVRTGMDQTNQTSCYITIRYTKSV